MKRSRACSKEVREPMSVSRRKSGAIACPMNSPSKAQAPCAHTWYRRFRFTEHGLGLLYAAVMRDPPMRDSLKMIISASTCNMRAAESSHSADD